MLCPAQMLGYLQPIGRRPDGQAGFVAAGVDASREPGTLPFQGRIYRRQSSSPQRRSPDLLVI
jgi:hypothetical protein